MPRVPLLDPAQLDEPAKSLVANHPIDLFRTLANSPGAFQQFANFGMWIRHDSTFDARLREIAILTVGVIDDSPYEFSHHVKIGHDFGMSDEDVTNVVAQIRDGKSELNAIDRLIVDATHQVTVNKSVDENTWTSLLAEFGMERSVELVVIAAHYSCVTRVLGALQIGVESSYEQYLAALR